MNRIKKVLLGLALAFVCVVTLASCSKVSQSYADKINEAAKTEEKITYDDAKSALGDECFDVTLLKTGVLYAVKGFKNDMTEEELEKKFDEADENTKFEAIIIAVVAGKCTAAAYVSGTAAEIEAKLDSMMN